MRAYFFCNYYLSSIQQGIQSAHCVADMFVRYQMRSTHKKHLYDWAENYKTMVVLNGGNSKDIDAIYKRIINSAEQECYPYVKFKEDKQSLNSATTCVGVVLPEKVYGFAQELRDHGGIHDSLLQQYVNHHQLTAYDIDLAELIRSYSLAR